MSTADFRLFDARLEAPVKYIVKHHNPTLTLHTVANFALAETVRSLLDELQAEDPTDANIPLLAAICDQVSRDYQKVTP